MACLNGLPAPNTTGWADDKRNGKGTMKWSNGDVYTGYWQNDLQHGRGEMKFSKTKQLRKGIWKNGAFME